jgi:hypothetical protein
MRRLYGTLIILVAILFAPYWIYLPLLFIALATFSFYWEGIFLGFLIDIYYGINLLSFSNFPYTVAMLSSIILFASLPIRKKIRYHA